MNLGHGIFAGKQQAWHDSTSQIEAQLSSMEVRVRNMSPEAK
jgi:hypothetical protein